MINETDIKIIELNISCSNVAEGGMAFGIKCDSAERIVKEIRKNTDKIAESGDAGRNHLVTIS